MAQKSTVRVSGLRELRVSLAKVDAEMTAAIDAELKAIAGTVAERAKSMFSPIDARSAAGFKPRVRGFTRVTINQSKRRKTGRRPDYGALQMTRALIPALNDEEENIKTRLEATLAMVELKHGF